MRNFEFIANKICTEKTRTDGYAAQEWIIYPCTFRSMFYVYLKI